MKKFLNIKLALIFIVSVIFRFWLISNNHIYFWFDQARDANVSQEIIYQHDLKIQGPSASGTNDTIYHGVLYYYLLGPIYSIFHGNPFFVSLTFGIINSFAVLILYFLTEKIFKNKKTALLASFLLAINFENAEYSTWLSNPMMGLIPILLFFLSIWIIFYQEQHKDRFKWMIVMGFSLGIIEQSAFYSIYFFGPVIIGLIYLSKKLNLSLNKIFTLKEIFAFLIPYFFTIFSMILNQFLLFRAGIFTLKGFESAIGRSNIFSEPKMILEIVNTYLIKYISTVTPSNYLFGIFFALLIIYILFFKKSLKKTSIFLLSWLTAPLWLFIFHFRSSPHMLIGIEYMILISFSFVLIIFLNNKNIFLKTFSISLFFLYVIFQISALVKIREKDSSIFTFQTGVMLHNEIKLIDKTYQIANGRPFSISIWGSPYEYYITWAYLYDWYGKEKYGYVPSYFGTSQIGKYGEKILEQKNSPENLHFLIEEPKIYMVGNIYESFMNKQNSFSKVIYDEKSTNNGIEFFGKYSLQTRENIE